MGNHEEMFLTTLAGRGRWLKYTSSTWDSMSSLWKKPLFSIQDLVKECSNRGITAFLDNLLPYYENQDYICTHAPLEKIVCYLHGLQRYTAEAAQEYFLDRILLDIRWGGSDEDPKLSYIPEMKKYHICGHQYKQHNQPRIYKHRAFIDVGCGKVTETPLVAVKFPEKKVFRSFQKPI